MRLDKLACACINGRYCYEGGLPVRCWIRDGKPEPEPPLTPASWQAACSSPSDSPRSGPRTSCVPSLRPTWTSSSASQAVEPYTGEKVADPTPHVEKLRGILRGVTKPTEYEEQS